MSDSISEWTDWPSLWEIARRRGIADPKSCRVLCGSCGAELSDRGIVHWPDCDGDWDQIVFAKQNAAGEWKEQGSGSSSPNDGPLPLAIG